MQPDPVAALRAIRRELEAATADLRAVSEQLAHLEDDGEPLDTIGGAIVEAMAADAIHRGERAKAATAAFAIEHPEVMGPKGS